MENKKNNSVNLEKKRSIFLQIGLIIAFSMILYAFEWASPDLSYNKSQEIAGVDIEIETVPITRVKETKPPPPKHYKKLEITTRKDIEQEYIPPSVDIEPDEKIHYQVKEIIEKPVDKNRRIIFIPDVMPKFPGGIAGLKKFIVNNIEYPTAASEINIQGKVYVRFVVNYKGETEQVSIIRGVDPLLDKEAIRVVKILPKWEPGRQNGKAVSVWFTVPIAFQLQK